MWYTAFVEIQGNFSCEEVVLILRAEESTPQRIGTTEVQNIQRIIEKQGGNTHNKVGPSLFVHASISRWIWIFKYRRTAFHIWMHRDGRIF